MRTDLTLALDAASAERSLSEGTVSSKSAELMVLVSEGPEGCRSGRSKAEASAMALTRSSSSADRQPSQPTSGCQKERFSNHHCALQGWTLLNIYL